MRKIKFKEKMILKKARRNRKMEIVIDEKEIVSENKYAEENKLDVDYIDIASKMYAEKSEIYNNVIYNCLCVLEGRSSDEFLLLNDTGDNEKIQKRNVNCLQHAVLGKLQPYYLNYDNVKELPYFLKLQAELAEKISNIIDETFIDLENRNAAITINPDFFIHLQAKKEFIKNFIFAVSGEYNIYIQELKNIFTIACQEYSKKIINDRSPYNDLVIFYHTITGGKWNREDLKLVFEAGNEYGVITAIDDYYIAAQKKILPLEERAKYVLSIDKAVRSGLVNKSVSAAINFDKNKFE